MLLRAHMMDAALREALIARVQDCARNASAPLSVQEMDLTALTKPKVLPMIHGLFPQAERMLLATTIGPTAAFCFGPTLTC
jgi:hypothetical protein